MIIFSGLLINAIVNTFPGNHIATKAEFIINSVVHWEYDGNIFKNNLILSLLT